MENTGQTHWIPLSDLMTGLMMVFLLISVALIWRASEVLKVSTQIVTDYEQTKSDLEQALQEEFKEDLKRWNAEILADLTVRFKDPQTLFKTGSAVLEDEFKKKLDEFLPKYVAILTSDKYRSAVKEVRIEGHTSSFWIGAKTPQEAYFRNMELSQSRTRSTLEYLLNLASLQGKDDWLRQHVTANGLSSSRPVQGGSQRDVARNQRVEFRVTTNAEERINELEYAIAQLVHRIGNK